MQWISVNERLPETNENYLICYEKQSVDYSVIGRPMKTTQFIDIAFFYQERWQLNNDDEYVIPTHWMPLPDYP